jgi:hypothetical protein
MSDTPTTKPLADTTKGTAASPPPRHNIIIKKIEAHLLLAVSPS